MTQHDFCLSSLRPPCSSGIMLRAQTWKLARLRKLFAEIKEVEYDKYLVVIS